MKREESEGKTEASYFSIQSQREVQNEVQAEQVHPNTNRGALAGKRKKSEKNEKWL